MAEEVTGPVTGCPSQRLAVGQRGEKQASVWWRGLLGRPGSCPRGQVVDGVSLHGFLHHVGRVNICAEEQVITRLSLTSLSSVFGVGEARGPSPGSPLTPVLSVVSSC